MIRTTLCLSLVCVLSGCMNLYAGITQYAVKPFYDTASQSVICCEAKVTSGKNAGSVVAHITKAGDTVTVDLTEQGVDASSSISAAGATVSDVAGAVSNAAVSAVKILH